MPNGSRGPWSSRTAEGLARSTRPSGLIPRTPTREWAKRSDESVFSGPSDTREGWPPGLFSPAGLPLPVSERAGARLLGNAPCPGVLEGRPERRGPVDALEEGLKTAREPNSPPSAPLSGARKGSVGSRRQARTPTVATAERPPPGSDRGDKGRAKRPRPFRVPAMRAPNPPRDRPEGNRGAVSDLSISFPTLGKGSDPELFSPKVKEGRQDDRTGAAAADPSPLGPRRHSVARPPPPVRRGPGELRTGGRKRGRVSPDPPMGGGG